MELRLPAFQTPSHPWKTATLIASAVAALELVVIVVAGIARGLGLERVLELNLASVDGLMPERTFLLVVDRLEARRRSGAARDRIERESDEFVASVERAYERVAERFPDRIVTVDDVGSRNEVAERVHGELRQLS